MDKCKPSRIERLTANLTALNRRLEKRVRKNQSILEHLQGETELAKTLDYIKEFFGF